MQYLQDVNARLRKDDQYGNDLELSRRLRCGQPLRRHGQELDCLLRNRQIRRQILYSVCHLFRPIPIVLLRRDCSGLQRFWL